MKWNKADIDPGFKGSDQYYLVVLNNKFVTVSYFFVDSYGSWWSSPGNIFDQCWSEGQITHWAKLPKLPKD